MAHLTRTALLGESTPAGAEGMLRWVLPPLSSGWASAAPAGELAAEQVR